MTTPATAVDFPGARPAPRWPSGRGAWAPPLSGTLRSRALPDTRVWAVYLFLHLPLVMAIKLSPLIATAHTFVTLAIGIHCVFRFRTPEKAICMMGYVVASEPLWRLGRAMVFHETGKYLLALLSILSLAKFGLSRRADRTALVYFALLLPSLLVLPEFDRRMISFNLSGPFSLAAATLALSAVRLSPQALRKLFLTILGPIVGFAFVASFMTVTTEEIDFYSSKVAAGGLGNNQASSILGLGVMVAFLYVCIARRPRALRWIVAGVGLWSAVQAGLTFSRGGVATAAGAIAAASFFLLRDRDSRAFVFVRLVLIVLIATFWAIPLLNSVTSGSFERRFSSGHLTGRDKIIQADIIAFKENPIFGVGPGQSKDYHALTFSRASTHTEYSRLLAEHGLFGLAALMLLGWMTFKRLNRRAPPAGKAVAAALTLWTLLFMFHAAMRMAAASFTFALGAAYLMADDRVRPRPVAKRITASAVRTRPEAK